MLEENISNLLLQSRFSTQFPKDKPNNHEYESKLTNLNLDQMQSKSIKHQLLMKTKELQIAHCHLQQYRQRQQEWKETEMSLNQQLHDLRVSVIQLCKQIQLLKHNHSNEIQFYIQKEKKMLTTLSTFLCTKQVQRHETQPIFSQQTIDLQPLHLFSQSTLENIKEMGISLEAMEKLPQIKKLKKQPALNQKKLDWYLSQHPFYQKDREVRHCVALYILRDKNNGKQVFERVLNILNMSKITTKRSTMEENVGIPMI